MMSPLEISEICAQACDSKKAIDIKILDVGDILNIAQYFVICSGSSDRQVKAIVDSLIRQTRKLSIKPIGIEGERELEWVCVDFGDVIVHVFLNESRDFYKIERLFKDAESIDWHELNEDAV
ncbi:MAG: ribosome silencing factor [Acidimicrobiia bacterium]